MNANHKVLIFTDLDGSLLDRDTFKFDKISNYIKEFLFKKNSLNFYIFEFRFKIF